MNNAELLFHNMSQLLKDMRANHRGPPLWLLNEHQLEIYRNFQCNQSERIRQYEQTNGPGNRFEDYLNGNDPFAGIELDDEVAEVLRLNAAPTAIPADATEQQVSQIYQEFLDDL